MKRIVFAVLALLMLPASVLAKDSFKKFVERHDVDNNVRVRDYSENPTGFWNDMVESNQSYKLFLEHMEKKRGAEKEALKFVEDIPRFDKKYSPIVLEGGDSLCMYLRSILGEVENLDLCVVNDYDVNAFTTYSHEGKIIGLNMGLLNARGMTEGMLIGVLAHEYTHACLDHLLQHQYNYAKKKRKNKLIAGIAAGLTAAAAMTDAAFSASAGRETNPEPYVKLANEIEADREMATLKYFFSYSREQELEADLVAYRFMEATGYNPDDYIEMLRLLGANNYDNNFSDELEDHPSINERISFLMFVKDNPDIKNTINWKTVKNKVKARESLFQPKD